MSERLPDNNQSREFLLPSAETPLRLPDAAHAEKLRPGEQDPLQALIEARSDIAKAEQADTRQAVSESLKASEGAAQASTLPNSISRDLKNITLKRELNGIQRRLSSPQRALSKVVHQPTIKVVSEAAGSTVSRPSGILGGGILAFIGTSAYLYLAKYIGFEYNFGVFLALFVAGFVLGLVLEMLVHIAFKARKSATV